MFKRVRNHPIWILFVEDRLRNISFAILTLTFNLIASLLEGVSFTLIWFSFIYLSEGTPTFLPHKLEGYLMGLGQIQLFTIFMLSAVSAQILRSSFTYFGQMVTVFLTVNLQTRAQQTIYHQIFCLSFASVNHYKMGDLIHYVTAPPNYFRNLMEWINRVIVSLMMILVYMVFMTQISLSLTFCTLTLFGGTVFLQKALIKTIIKASQDQMYHLVELNKETVQNVSALRTVHLFHQQNRILHNIGKTLKDIAFTSLRLNKWNQLILPFNEVIGVILVGLATILGLVLLKGSNFQMFPALLTFLALTYRLGTRLQVVMNGFSEIAFNTGPIERLKEILLKEGKEFLDLSIKPAITFQREINFDRVALRYPEKKDYAVHEVSFTIPKGSVIAFVGESGGGKSSLLDLLLRLYEPTSGKIYVDGKPLTNFSLQSWRSHFGVVSQDVFLFHDSIASNIRFGKEDATNKEVIEAAQLAGIHTFIDHLPQRYQTCVGERGYQLSGGEKQRIALARALIRKPKILVLDEATSNLDSQSEQIIQETLKEMRGIITILIVAHRLVTIHMADQIIMLDKGRIIEQGTHDDLLQLEGSYHHFWSLQPDLSSFALD